MGCLLFTTDQEALPVIAIVPVNLTRLMPGSRADHAPHGSRRRTQPLIIGVNVFPRSLEGDLKFEHLAPHYRLEVNRRGHLDALAVRVERRERAGAES